MHYQSDIATVDGKTVHPGYMLGERVHGSKWTWPRWVPPRDLWKVWASAIQSYLMSQFPIRKRPKSHQKIETWVDRDHTEVEIQGVTYKVTERQRFRSHLRPGAGDKIRTEPCDVYGDKGEVFLLPHRRIETIEEEREEEKSDFLESLVASEPSMGYIFRKIPNKEEDHGAIADLMIKEQLVAGSDGGDD